MFEVGMRVGYSAKGEIVVLEKYRALVKWDKTGRHSWFYLKALKEIKEDASNIGEISKATNS